LYNFGILTQTNKKQLMKNEMTDEKEIIFQTANILSNM